jgi:hypothetical protein
MKVGSGCARSVPLWKDFEAAVNAHDNKIESAQHASRCCSATFERNVAGVVSGLRMVRDAEYSTPRSRVASAIVSSVSGPTPLPL